MLEVEVLPSHFAALALEQRMEASDGRNNQSPTPAPFPWAPSQTWVHLPAGSDPHSTGCATWVVLKCAYARSPYSILPRPPTEAAWGRWHSCQWKALSQPLT